MIHFATGLDYVIGVGFTRDGQTLEEAEWRIEAKAVWDSERKPYAQTPHAIRMRKLRAIRRWMAA